MTVKQREYLNNYHAFVYEKLAPMMDEAERAWLKDATRAI
jgi:Xaa-Pro aminopeptidase